jgi:predicted choloylglycine hydrolase
MDWQIYAEDAVRRHILEPQVRDMVLARLKGISRPVAPAAGQRIEFTAVAEPRPGGHLRRLYQRAWPAYRRWYLRDGEAARPSLDEGRSALEQHMPELVATWSALVEAVGADDLGARMLTLYDPPPLVSGCSQAALADAAVLVRNYDYDPALLDGVVLDTKLTGTRVIGMADQLWGLLDGINDRGLAASFTFGGRRSTGRGFSIPLVIRYVLETCATVEDAIAVLGRLPVQSAYNITLVDRGGRHATVWVAPGEAARVTPDRAATNHQGVVDWPEHARWTRSVERLDHLTDLVESGEDATIGGMLRPPMRNLRYDEGFGTLYTAVYRPSAGEVEYRWPGRTWEHSFARFREETMTVDLGELEAAATA